MSEFTIPRPEGGDVVDLITDDHRLLEDLMRAMRDETADRDGARSAFSHLLIAHSVAEEEGVYPRLKSKAVIDGEEEHGEEEHAATNASLLTLLRVEDTGSSDFESAVEEVATVLNHHIGEEELTILNPAQTETPKEVRERLGAAWAARRNELIAQDCGSPEQVERIVREAHEQGLLPNDEQPRG